jgi:hypothetical protein
VRQSNTAGVVELVDTQDLGSCAFGCEGSSPSFGTVLDCSLRSLWIALQSPPTSSSLADEKRVCSLLLSTAARDPRVNWLRANSKAASDPARSPDVPYSLPGALAVCSWLSSSGF